MSDDRYREWDAAYVLGALSVDDRRAFERHLPSCGSCREAVRELAPVPGLLRSVVPGVQPATPGADAADDREAAASDPAGLAALADRVRRRRSRNRMLLAAASVAIALAGGTAGYALSAAPADQPAVVASPSTDAPVRLDPVHDSGVRADLAITEQPWGSRLDWSCTYPSGVSRGHDYELVVVDTLGARTIVATWTGDGEEKTTGLSAATSLARSQISRVELSLVASGTVLASAEY
ncbi:anti-sigma factor [Microbacterium sp. 179-I 3D2 NHS]|uniref:anti-sigma factor family protein n=1 Tax=Microbacterium sp. 179-I 3D2 NHS TaxID=3235178 RepID=UPI0039A171F7